MKYTIMLEDGQIPTKTLGGEVFLRL